MQSQHEQPTTALVQHWRALVEQSDSASFLLDDRGQLVAVSPPLAAATGRAARDMLGESARAFIHPEDRARAEQQWDERRQRGGDRLGLEHRWRHDRGGDRWLSWYLAGDAQSGHVYATGHDITARKHQALLSRETESMARTGGWSFEVATGELFWTEETYRLHDVEPGEYEPTVDTAMAFYTEQSRAQIEAAFQRLLADGEPYDLRLELTTATGRHIRCRAKGLGVVEDGAVVRAYGAFQDISEESKVQNALRESDDLLRSILRDMRAGLVAQRPDGSIFLSNQAALDILGLTEDQITGRTSMDEEWYAIHEDGSPFPGETHPAMVSLRTGESVAGVIMGVFRPRTRDRVWILIDSVVQRNAQGEVLRVLCSFIDITDRKRAEDAARASDAMFRAVYQNAGVGVLLRDAQTEQIECNPTFERMLGRTSEQLRTLSLRDLVHPEDAAASAELHRDLLEGRTESYEVERRFERADGELVWGHETVSLVRGADDEPRQVVEVIADITDRKRMETQLMLADRMASLGTMAAGVGHEINNPLTWISGNVTLALELLEELGPQIPAEQLHEVKQVLEEAELGTSRVSAIVRDLRMFSRLEDKPGATANPNKVVESTCRMLHNELKHRTEFELDLGAVPRVVGDPPRLGQVLTNLLVNALHALPERPKRDNLIRVSTRMEGGRVVLSVSDNGTGIPPEIQSRIFDPFFTTKGVGSGTGLGLSICHSLLTRIGGHIDLESEPGQGTLFRVTLQPSAAAPEVGATPEPEHQAPSTRKRILCIDDEPSVGTMIMRFLRKAHDVVIETDSEHAIARIEGGERFDAIICDLMMPVMSGIEFFDRLEVLDPSLATRCGFITGGVFTERARSFTESLPSSRLVRKPFRPQAIRTLVEHLIA